MSDKFPAVIISLVMVILIQRGIVISNRDVINKRDNTYFILYFCTAIYITVYY